MILNRLIATSKRTRKATVTRTTQFDAKLKASSPKSFMERQTMLLRQPWHNLFSAMKAANTTAASMALALLFTVISQSSANCAEETPQRPTRSRVSQASIQDHYEKRFAQWKERKIKRMQMLEQDGSAPATTVHGSTPLAGTEGGPGRPVDGPSIQAIL